MSLEQMHEMNGKICPCGKTHGFSAQVITGAGALNRIPYIVKEYQAEKVYLLWDKNTYAAAGKQVEALLTAAGITSTAFCFPQKCPEPDEKSVGAAVMHYPEDCQMVIAVGSGVINDIGKIVSAIAQKPFMIVATAPSMDGYASASSSMTRSGLKISLPSKSAQVIVGDTEVLCKAPVKMMKSGLGDMLAKYVSICEWRIANLITGEYYCEEIASLIRSAVKRCVDNAPGLLRAEPEAVEAVFEGLVIGGVAMNYAGLSRPASGVEHYISHVLDMRGVEFGAPVDFHGIQCAVGTRYAVALYEKLKGVKPDKETALSYARSFSYDAWKEELRKFLGKGAESMIALEEKEKKYDAVLHEKRLDAVLKNWDQILQIMEEELPTEMEISDLLDSISAPKTLTELGIPEEQFAMVFKSTKDIRDKYVLSRLLWDLGILEELLEK